jgi:hypothetical protein
VKVLFCCYIRHDGQAYLVVAKSLYSVCKFGLSALVDEALKLDCYVSFAWKVTINIYLAVFESIHAK